METNRANNLDVAKTSGIDQISTKFLKVAAPVIDNPLVNILIINLSIKLDTYPSKWKVAKIKPMLIRQNETHRFFR